MGVDDDFFEWLSVEIIFRCVPPPNCSQEMMSVSFIPINTILIVIYFTVNGKNEYFICKN